MKFLLLIAGVLIPHYLVRDWRSVYICTGYIMCFRH